MFHHYFFINNGVQTNSFSISCKTAYITGDKRRRFYREQKLFFYLSFMKLFNCLRFENLKPYFVFKYCLRIRSLFIVHPCFNFYPMYVHNELVQFQSQVMFVINGVTSQYSSDKTLDALVKRLAILLGNTRF